MANPEWTEPSDWDNRAPAENDANGCCLHCGRDNAGHEGDPCDDDCPLYDAEPPYRGALIEQTAHGSFFIHTDHGEGGPVWDGDTWRGFGMAEMYPDYRSAFIAARAANAARTTQVPA